MDKNTSFHGKYTFLNHMSKLNDKLVYIVYLLLEYVDTYLLGNKK